MKIIIKPLVIVLLCIIFIMLSGCGGIAAPPKGRELKSDFLESGYVVSSFSDYTISSFRVNKRQTNKDRKTDIAYCTAVFKGNGNEATIDCALHYSFYDVGGWQFEYVETVLVEYRLLAAPELSEVESVFAEYMATSYESYELLEITDFNAQENSCVLIGKAESINNYVDDRASVRMDCHFDTTSGFWEIVDVEEDASVDFEKLVGSYSLYFDRNGYGDTIGELQIYDYDDKGIYYTSMHQHGKAEHSTYAEYYVNELNGRSIRFAVGISGENVIVPMTLIVGNEVLLDTNSFLYSVDVTRISDAADREPEKGGAYWDSREREPLGSGEYAGLEILVEKYLNAFGNGDENAIADLILPEFKEFSIQLLATVGASEDDLLMWLDYEHYESYGNKVSSWTVPDIYVSDVLSEWDFFDKIYDEFGVNLNMNTLLVQYALRIDVLGNMSGGGEERFVLQVMKYNGQWHLVPMYWL